MNGTLSLSTKSDFVLQAQKLSDDLYYNHIDIVLAFQNSSATEQEVKAFSNLGQLKSVQLVGEVNESLYAVYLCVPKGNQNYASTIQQTIKRFLQTVKTTDKLAYQFVTSSKIGISVLGGDCVNFKTAITHAFQATMAHEKKQKQRVSFFDSELQRELKRQLLLEDIVKIAIDNDDVNIVYQPIISTKSWAIEGYEVLSRFTVDPVLKAQTRDLIKICEDLNLISELDLLTYHKALHELAPHIANSNIFFNINLSTNTRESFSDVIDCVDLLTRQNKLEHSRLVIDISPIQNQFKTDLEQGTKQLTTLTEKGSTLALADLSLGFDIGTVLAKGNYRYLRLDERFRRKFNDDSGYYQVVKLMVKLCHDLGVKVIIEGVNSVDQARVLAFLGIDYLQGSLFTQPAKIDEFAELPGRVNQVLDMIFEHSGGASPDTAELFINNIGSIPTHALPRIDPSSPISLVNQYFKTQSVTVIPVINDKICVGIVERSKINLFLTPTMGTNLESEKDARVWRRPINSVMDVKFNSVDVTLDIDSLLSLIKDKTYELPLVITSKGRYTGILTKSDLIDYLLDKER